MVRDLGVFLDNTLSMTNHISTVTKSCFFHLRRIRQIKRCLNEKCLRTLVQALVISRLDYCNSILISLPDTTLHPYTTILYSAARLVKSLKPRDHITPSSSATPLASHQSANLIQNLCPHVQHPFRFMSALHVILGHTVHNSRIEIESSSDHLPKATT